MSDDRFASTRLRLLVGGERWLQGVGSSSSSRRGSGIATAALPSLAAAGRATASGRTSFSESDSSPIGPDRRVPVRTGQPRAKQGVLRRYSSALAAKDKAADPKLTNAAAIAPPMHHACSSRRTEWLSLLDVGSRRSRFATCAGVMSRPPSRTMLCQGHASVRSEEATSWLHSLFPALYFRLLITRHQ